MISANMATPGLLKKKYFEIKFLTSYILSMTSTTNFFTMTQVMSWMRPCDQRLVTLAFV